MKNSFFPFFVFTCTVAGVKGVNYKLAIEVVMGAAEQKIVGKSL